MNVNTSTATTALGSGIALTELQSINFPLLLHGDSGQIGILVRGLLMLIFSWYTNRKGKVGATVPTTPEPVAGGK